MNQLRLFLVAIQYFTRLPVPPSIGHSAEKLNLAARYFPLVGLLVGGLCAITLWFGVQVFPVQIAILLSMLVGLLVTGAFHEDGLADFVDGFGGGHSQERILEIMKDSRVGSFGVIATVMSLLLKFALLQTLTAHSIVLVLYTLMVAHVISRCMAASLLYTQDYLRVDNAKSKPVAHAMSHLSFAVIVLTGMGALLLLWLNTHQLSAIGGGLGAALLAHTYVTWRIHRTLGGYTGDCLGAVQQITELAFYLGVLAAIPT